jgi:hypothetical protein
MENVEQAQVASTEGVGGDMPMQTPAQPELTINDLQNLRAVVDAAVRRGAFGAAEISEVGKVFDRLNTFLNSVAPAQTATEQTQDTQAPAA